MGNYGIKITRVGYDVADATLLQQSFNSEKNCPKIALTGTSTSSASGSRTIEITHGLSFTPAYMIWFDVDASGTWFPTYSMEHLSGKYCYVNGSTDATKLYLDFYSTGSASIRCYYFLFADLAD